jgi:folylpolyglutamate synthase/dihydropteroate synthase
MDHVDALGASLKSTAPAKAEIMKQGVPVLLVRAQTLKLFIRRFAESQRVLDA